MREERDEARAQLEQLRKDNADLARAAIEKPPYKADLIKALEEIEKASGDDDDADCQHYSWIRDTAREALRPLMTKDAGVITDGHGGTWMRCDHPACERPTVVAGLPDKDNNDG